MKPKRPHLFLICVDALRGDCFDDAAPVWEGIGRPETPRLDRLSAESRRWRAQAASSWTKPSVPSIITSRHPSEHGVLEVGRAEGTTSSATLPDDVPTLAELLSESGYSTIGLAHNAQLDASLGFGRGYDVFTSDGGPAPEIVERLSALGPWRSGPAFVHLHLLEPHWPFTAPIRRRAESRREGRFEFHRMKAAAWKDLKKELKTGRVVLTEEEVRFLRWVYRIAVEEVDAAVGALLDRLDADGVLEESVVVFTADHGEELLDHGGLGHGQSLAEELIRIPLFLRAGARSGVSASPGEIDEPAGHTDLLPTLLGAAGTFADQRVSGRDLLREEAPGCLFSEVKHKRRYRQAVCDGRWKLVRTFRFEKARDGAADDKNNLQELMETRPYEIERELYDLRDDPGERNDRAAERPSVVARLEQALQHWWDGRTVSGRGAKELEEELIQRLQALGYL